MLNSRDFREKEKRDSGEGLTAGAGGGTVCHRRLSESNEIV